MTTQFDGKKAYRHLKVLAKDIGPRHGSSKNEQLAAKYIHGYFKDLGLKTKYNRYPIYSFESAEASLTAPGGESYTCKPFPMTANSPTKGVTGEVIVLDDANALFLDDSITGKIVVTFNVFKPEDHELFMSYKPKGLVSIQSGHSQLHVAAPRRYDFKKDVPTVPSVCLTYTDGLALLNAAPKELTLCSKTVGGGWRSGNNVIADLPGTGSSEEVIIICAHYDSVWTGPGAFDNGGGTAAIMELARVYKKQGSKYNLRFCAFGGEETGLWGSKSYVKQLKDKHDKVEKARERSRNPKKSELEHILFVINLDMMGMHVGRSNALMLGHTDIAASVRLLSNKERYPIALQEDKLYSSDNWYFNMVGIPSLSFNRMGYANGNGHTAGDTIENCSPEGIEHIASFVETWINQYVMDLHAFPFPRALPPSAQKAVDDRRKERGPFADYDTTALLKKAKGK